jgi:hypothetical protein
LKVTNSQTQKQRLREINGNLNFNSDAQNTKFMANS